MRLESGKQILQFSRIDKQIHEKANFYKFSFLFSALRFPKRGRRGSPPSPCPAAIFLFDKSQRKMAAGLFLKSDSFLLKGISITAFL